MSQTSCKNFAAALAIYLKSKREARQAHRGAICSYECRLCNEEVLTDVNPIYSYGWCHIKDAQYLCVQCTSHVSLLASMVNLEAETEMVSAF